MHRDHHPEVDRLAVDHGIDPNIEGGDIIKKEGEHRDHLRRDGIGIEIENGIDIEVIEEEEVDRTEDGIVELREREWIQVIQLIREMKGRIEREEKHGKEGIVGERGNIVIGGEGI